MYKHMLDKAPRRHKLSRGSGWNEDRNVYLLGHAGDLDVYTPTPAHVGEEYPSGHPMLYKGAMAVAELSAICSADRAYGPYNWTVFLLTDGGALVPLDSDVRPTPMEMCELYALAHNLDLPQPKSGTGDE